MQSCCFVLFCVQEEIGSSVPAVRRQDLCFSIRG